MIFNWTSSLLHRRELTPGTVIMVIIGVWEIIEPGCPRRTATNSVFGAQVSCCDRQVSCTRLNHQYSCMKREGTQDATLCWLVTGS